MILDKIKPSKIKYAYREIRRKGNDPYWWQLRFLSKIAGPTLKYIYRNFGEDFMEKDWDNLLILDACRADMFEECFDTSRFDSYRRIHSIGCSSPEWIETTFKGEKYKDTIYITANPWISKIAPNSVCEIVNLWVDNYPISEKDLQGALDLSDVDGVDLTEDPTIYAGEVNRAAKKAFENHPNKRFIIHYFQPHAPVVGNPDGSRKENIRGELNPGSELRNGLVEREEVWKAYKDNLQYVFHHAENLAKELGGKSVFTADHGDLFGDIIWPFPVRGYEHPSGLRHPNLTRVPWAEISVGYRREIIEGEISEHKADQEEIDTRLKELGYKT